MKIKLQKKDGLWFLKMLLFLGLIILAYVAYLVFGVAHRKSQVQKEILSLQQEAVRIEKENNVLNDKLAYFESMDFQKKEVKDKLGLQEPDENLVIVKPGPIREKQADLPKEKQENKTKEEISIYKKWWNYFFKY
jgi:cell division protein FtsB